MPIRSLAGMTFSLKFLPVEPELKPFGYDLFTKVPTTFAPASDIPVPSNYVIGPGDTIELQLIGDGGGRLPARRRPRRRWSNLPELGPIAVAGLRFDAAKAMIEQRVAEPDDRHARERVDRRAALDPGLRDGRGGAAGLVHGRAASRRMTNALFASGGVKRDRIAAHDPS